MGTSVVHFIFSDVDILLSFQKGFINWDFLWEELLKMINSSLHAFVLLINEARQGSCSVLFLAAIILIK
jgi:hypothetical protein